MRMKRKKALAMNTLALNNLCNWHLSGVLGGEGSSPNSKQQAEKSGGKGEEEKKKKKKLPFSDTPFLPPFLGGEGLYFNSYYYNCELVTNFHFCP
jgi:hypothetical protein